MSSTEIANPPKNASAETAYADRFENIWRMAPGLFIVDGEHGFTTTDDLTWTCKQVYDAIAAHKSALENSIRERAGK